MKPQQALDEFKKQLRLGGYAFNTIETYSSCAAIFIYKFKDHKPTKSEIEDWLLTYESEVYRKHLLCSVKCINKIIFGGRLDVESIPNPRPQSKLPEILSPEEVQRIFNVCENVKHKSIIALLYSAGLRISEVINLRLKDIDRSRKIINIRQAKGKKDRQVPLNEKVLALLETYYHDYTPKEYVFNGQFTLPYSTKSVQEFLKTLAKKAGIKKRVHPHQFRHSCFTELFNVGTDSVLIQRIAGHSKQATTLRYLHLSNIHISNVNSPINQINI